MAFLSNITYVYSGVLILGGTMGYVKSGSVMSVVMGSLFGILIGVNGLSLSSKAGSTLPAIMNLVLCVCLLGIMGSRYVKSGKFMPAGMVAALSAVMALAYVSFLMSPPPAAKRS